MSNMFIDQRGKIVKLAFLESGEAEKVHCRTRARCERCVYPERNKCKSLVPAELLVSDFIPCYAAGKLQGLCHDIAIAGYFIEVQDE